MKAMNGIRFTPQQGLKASQAQRRPIPGKFELEYGKLQLPVYAEKRDKFSETIADHPTASVAKSETITEAEDLTHAKAQGAAMAAAKVSLKMAVDKAVRSDAGGRAVAATPELKDGRPVASIVLLQAGMLHTVEQRLS